MRLALALLWLAAVPAHAQDTAPPPRLDLSGEAGWLTDFRFRGVSRSNRKPTVQASLRLDHLSGAYLSAWAAPISGRTLGGADAQIELSGGWAGNRGGWRPEVGATGYLFPDARGRSFGEVYAVLARDIGPLSASVGANYAPDQGSLRRDNIYVYGRIDAGVPGTPVSVSARLGRENGAFADQKLDWSLGATAALGPFTVGLRYVDSDVRGRLGGAGAVFSMSAGF